MYPLPEKESSRLIEQTNRIGVEFLLADLNTGMTFLQIAFVTSSPANRARNLGRACEVYRTVMRLLPRLVLAPDAQLEIDRKLEDLKNSLEEAGYSCTGN